MKILVNCALPYANGPLHLGHIAGAYLGADIFVRYHRMVGDDVLFISGSDEYGTPITITADKLKKSPQEVADFYHQDHEETFRALGIEFDIFSRTTYPEHHATVAEFLDEFQRKGYLSEGTMVSAYCPVDQRFLPDRYVHGTCPYCGFKDARGDQCDECGRTLDPKDLLEPRCSICGTAPEFRESRHLFFRLDLFADRLMEWLDSKGFWKPNVLAFTRNFIGSGLRERPITRDINWGVPVRLRGFEDKKVYVWFEALIGYISAARILSERRGKPDLWKEYYMDPEARVYYFIGKDNIPFHTIIWPAMLMAKGGINLPYDVPANEYLRFRGQQFSKSRGIGFTVHEALSAVPRDYLRFYMAMTLPESADSDFVPEDLVEKVNSELIDKYGNLVHRVVSLCRNNSIESLGPQDGLDGRVKEEVQRGLADYRDALEHIQVRRAVNSFLSLSKFINGYVNESQPWRLLKEDRERGRMVLHTCLYALQALTAMLYPVVPDAARKVWGIINPDREISLDVSEATVFRPAGGEIPFRKIDLSSMNPNSLDLRVARVVDVRDHPSADRLYLLSLDLGGEARQIVAGLRNHYRPEQLRGRKIIVVRNLKKSKIRGEVSEGMMLAADDGHGVHFLTVDSDVEPGTPVSLGDLNYNGSGSIDVEELSRFNLRALQNGGKKYVVATVDGREKRLMAGDVPVVFDGDIGGEARVR